MFSSKVVVALAALPFLAQAAYAQTCARSYTVQQGDICNSISAAHNVSTYQLAVVNAGTINEDCSNLVPGQTLCLGYTGSDCQNTYIVQLGDDCDGVASLYSINTTMLYENNPQIDSSCDNLYVGEVLCVASDVDVPTLSSGVPSASIATSFAASATLANATTIPSATIVNTSIAASLTTPAPTAVASSAEASASASATDSGDDGDDGDDDDLPWCDEL